MGRVNERGVYINHDGVSFLFPSFNCKQHFAELMCWLLFNERCYKRCKRAFWNRYLAWRGYSLIRLRTTLLVSNFCSVVLRDARYYIIHCKRHFRYSIVFIDKIMNVESFQYINDSLKQMLINICFDWICYTKMLRLISKLRNIYSTQVYNHHTLRYICYILILFFSVR